MIGLMRHKLPVSVLLLACVATAQAGEQETGTPVANEEFLFFLADWEDEKGNWQDPLDYDDPNWSELDNQQVKDDEQTISD